MTIASILTATAIIVSASACASSGGSASGASRAQSASRMDAAEFHKPEFRTMHDAVRILRPEWFVARGGPRSIEHAGILNPVVGVFIEGQARGYSLEKLGEFVPGDVKAARRIAATEAMTTYGTQWAWGGIVIVLAR